MFDRTIIDILEDQAQKSPDTTFIKFCDQIDSDLSFSATWVLANRWAQLLGGNVAAGRTVLIGLPNSADFVGAFFGCLLAGLVPAPCVPRGKRDLLSYVTDIGRRAKVVEAAVLVGEDKSLPLSELLLLDASDLPQSEPHHRRQPHPRAALQQFTSGTGGRLKAVELSHEALVYQAAELSGVLGANPALDRAFSWLPWFHDMGLFGFLLAPAYSGVTTCIVRTETFARRPAVWMEAISHERATITAGPPSAYVLAARIAERRPNTNINLGCIRVALLGAERITPTAIEHINRGFGPIGLRPQALLCAYGMAEVGVAVSVSPPERGPLLATTGSAGAPVSCGPAIPSTRIRVVDQAGDDVADCETGRILVRSPSLLTRYLTQDGQLYPLDADGWLPTNDLGHLENDELYVHGRCDDMIIVGGEKYPPEAFEDAVATSGIAFGEVAAVSFFDERAGSDRVLIIAESRFRDSERGEIKGAIRDALAAKQLPFAEVLLVKPKTIRRTANGKMQREQCRQLALESLVHE